MMGRRLYYQCSLGHYFTGTTHCPFDGWGSDRDIGDRLLVEDLPSGGTTSQLVQLGVPKQLVSRALILDFGSSRARFEALAPKGYLREYGASDLVPSAPDFPAPAATLDPLCCVLYFRCNGGHYYAGLPFEDDGERLARGSRCPFDGWSLNGFQEASNKFRKHLRQDAPTPEELTDDIEVLERLVVAQFADPSRAFRALEPMMYVDHGEVCLFDDIPLRFL